ncbi:unnamed protein product [Rotaria sp. Silwood2]|nr:unnamed protein product [Rotaria sp. Silwood2]CAF3928843.1 unnamed protein product [Rotaria sp. Silwood2]
MICNNEYILISANNYLYLFNGNLKLIRSNNNKKILKDDLKDLCWSSYLNNFIILTKKDIYLINPLTIKFSIIENIKLKDHREEYISCTCSQDKIYIIKYQLNTNSYYLEEYSLPTFRFSRKFQILDLIGTSLCIKNGFYNQFYNIQQIISIRYYEEKLIIIIKIDFNWFIYIFHLYDKPTFLTKIYLEDKSRMTILNSINQFVIVKDYLSNSFIKMTMDFENNFETNQFNQNNNYSKGFIDFNGKLRNVSSFGTSNIVFLIDDALLIYKL